MGIDAVLKSVADAVFQKPPLEKSQAVALPANAPDPDAVNAFKAAMNSGYQGIPPVEGVNSAQVDGVGSFHFSGDLETSPGALAPRKANPDQPSSDIQSEKWINSVLDVFEKESITHSDLFRVQVLASIAKVEVTRNSSITKSIDDGMKTILTSSS